MEHSANSIAVPSHAQIRARLISLGTSLNAWSQDHGYHPRYVRDVTRRWGGRDDAPRGRTAKRVLRALARTLKEGA